MREIAVLLCKVGLEKGIVIYWLHLYTGCRKIQKLLYFSMNKESLVQEIPNLGKCNYCNSIEYLRRCMSCITTIKLNYVCSTSNHKLL